MRLLAQALTIGALSALASCQAGCCSLRHSPTLCSLTEPLATEVSAASAAQAQLANAAALENAGNEGCVDRYFAACSWAWLDVDEGASCYNKALIGLIRSAQRFGRLDPARGLVVHVGGQPMVIPIAHHGAPWSACDYERLLPPPTDDEPLLTRRYCNPGVGVPLVVERARRDCDPLETRFYPEKFHFSTTAVLQFHKSDAAGGRPNAVLDFYNPLELGQVCLAGADLPLAHDLSAPLVKTLEEAPRSYFAGFLEPGRETTMARLTCLSPYQPGKIPVVLIHGLFSDPQSWADLINDVRATPGFMQRHQLWVFRYPTGQGFLQSAAVLRRELRAAVDSFDPACQDPALRQMVLIGHSMGGLIAKLQVVHSEEIIWSRVANQPLEQIVTTPATRAFLAEACYFDPLSEICRVIFIASPHRGSLCTSSLFGKCAAQLIEPSPEQTQLHDQLIRDNPNTFNPLLERRFPTSIDMLVPSSPLLDAMRQMKLRSGVKLHNIIGVSCPISEDGPSDGVVSVHSASHPGCQSIRPVNASHTRAHRDVATVCEILRILKCP